MKNTTTIIIAAGLALAIGLGAGYFIFGNQADTSTTHEHETMTDTATEETIYTCSMHPQVRQEEPGLCPICEMDLIPLSENTSDNPLVLEMTLSAVQLADIQTTVVGVAQASAKKLSLTGKIKADERTIATQSAHVPGRLEQLFVTFTGEQVRKGQQLATVYAPQLMTAQRELLEGLKLQNVDSSLAQAARQKLRYWKIDEATIQQVEESGEILSDIPVYADENGVVLEKMVQVGDYVSEGEPLLKLANLNRLWVLFDAYESDLAQIQKGDIVQFTTPSLPDRTFSAPITFIDPILDPNTRTAALRAEINNPRGVLKPEQFVRGTILAKVSSSEQLTVPKTAVLWTGERSVAYVQLPDSDIPSYEFREIELGERIGDSYVVASGLQAGEAVVTNGAFTIDAAAQLNNQASMMNRDVAIKGQSRELIGETPDYKDETPQAFQQQLAGLVEAYLPLKDALVATDAAASAEKARTFFTQLEAVDMSLVSGEAHEYWMQQQNALASHAQNITQQDDIEAQRKQFDFLSQALISTVKAFGVSQDKLYVQHCPMAFDDAGANWLSREEAILNPYFGEKMLRCGWVEEVLE